MANNTPENINTDKNMIVNARLNNYLSELKKNYQEDKHLETYSTMWKLIYEIIDVDRKLSYDTINNLFNQYKKYLSNNTFQTFLNTNNYDKNKDNDKLIIEFVTSYFELQNVKNDINLDEKIITSLQSTDYVDVIDYKHDELVIKKHEYVERFKQNLITKTLFTFHSSDFDTTNINIENEYTINVAELQKIGETSKIYSIKLVQCSIPINYKTYSSDNYTNTQFTITVTIDLSNITKIITIEDGFYLPDELANEIEFQLNKNIYDYYGTDESANLLDNLLHKSNYNTGYAFFKVVFNKVKNRIIIANTKHSFNITNKGTEKDGNTENNLLNYLGFENNNVDNYFNTSGNLYLGYLDYKKTVIYPANNNSNIYYIESDNPPNILGPRIIYMQLKSNENNDDLNTIINKSNTVKVNYFAKIPISNLPFAEIQDSDKGYLKNIVKIPGGKLIQNLVFNFKHHNSESNMSFKNTEFNFTLEIEHDL